MTAREAKRALTPDGFGRFLRWLSDDDELAVVEYQTIRRKLVRYFIHKGCSDPDELFDQTVDIVIRKIEVCAEYPSPLAYCYGVARNVWYQDMRERKNVELGENLVSPEVPDMRVREQELECLDLCMDQLSPTDRDVITRYHQGQGRDKIETRRLLADGLGGANALRIKMCRIRKELRTCVVQCTKRSVN
jgi:DNA-directed RNA polymerase specialized sigma24 family protein